MKIITKVTVNPSDIIDVGHGFAVQVEPYPTDEYGRFIVAQAIRNALDGLSLIDPDV